MWHLLCAHEASEPFMEIQGETTIHGCGRRPAQNYRWPEESVAPDSSKRSACKAWRDPRRQVYLARTSQRRGISTTRQIHLFSSLLIITASPPALQGFHRYEAVGHVGDTAA